MQSLHIKLWQFCHANSCPKGKHAKIFFAQIQDAIFENAEQFAFSIGWENAMRIWEYAQSVKAHEFANNFENFMCKYQRLLSWVDKNK